MEKAAASLISSALHGGVLGRTMSLRPVDLSHIMEVECHSGIFSGTRLVASSVRSVLHLLLLDLLLIADLLRPHLLLDLLSIHNERNQWLGLFK